MKQNAGPVAVGVAVVAIAVFLFFMFRHYVPPQPRNDTDNPTACLHMPRRQRNS